MLQLLLQLPLGRDLRHQLGDSRLSLLTFVFRRLNQCRQPRLRAVVPLPLRNAGDYQQVPIQLQCILSLPQLLLLPSDHDLAMLQLPKSIVVLTEHLPHDFKLRVLLLTLEIGLAELALQPLRLVLILLVKLPLIL